MPRVRRALVLVAFGLASLGVVAASAIGGSKPATTLATGNAAATSTEPTLTGHDDSVAETTTIVPSAPTTTTSAVATTIASPRRIPAAPTTTTTSTTVDERIAWITVVNHWVDDVKIGVEDANGNTWTLHAGEQAGPWALITADADHGDSFAVSSLNAEPCGYGDGEDFFRAGHSYTVEAWTDNRQPDPCGPGRPALLARITDETTGIARTFPAGRNS